MSRNSSLDSSDTAETDIQNADLGSGFFLGLTAGMMVANCGSCERDDCPR